MVSCRLKNKIMIEKIDKIRELLIVPSVDEQPKLAINQMKILNLLVELRNEAEQLTIPDVVKSLPTDECVEQWWVEGQDKKKVFWQEAPYRTNGDVVEEIKTALKYFIQTWQR